jgi:ferric-dicitrate binding protein FerR (iron transport regulator)
VDRNAGERRLRSGDDVATGLLIFRDRSLVSVVDEASSRYRPGKIVGVGAEPDRPAAE